MNLAERVFAALKSEEPTYKFIYYSPRRDALFCVKSVYSEINSKGKVICKWVRTFDGDKFGTDIKYSQCRDFRYVGKL